MPSVFIPKPPFPNIPFLLGVPQIVRSLLFQPANQVTLGAQAQHGLWASAQVAPSWGIYDTNGNKVIDPDNVYAFDNRAEWRESDYPVQRGAFDTFNKVIVPPESSVRMTKGGSLSARTAFLKSIDQIAGDTLTYNILTPEKTYFSQNVIRVELLRRSAEGAYFVEIDVFFRSIIEQNAQYSTTAASTANAVNPPALPAVNQGNVQPNSVVPNSVKTVATKAIASAPL
jgi:hypothetical protein